MKMEKIEILDKTIKTVLIAIFIYGVLLLLFAGGDPTRNNTLTAMQEIWLRIKYIFKGGFLILSSICIDTVLDSQYGWYK